MSLKKYIVVVERPWAKFNLKNYIEIKILWLLTDNTKLISGNSAQKQAWQVRVPTGWEQAC